MVMLEALIDRLHHSLRLGGLAGGRYQTRTAGFEIARQRPAYAAGEVALLHRRQRALGIVVQRVHAELLEDAVGEFGEIVADVLERREALVELGLLAAYPLHHFADDVEIAPLQAVDLDQLRIDILDPHLEHPAGPRHDVADLVARRAADQLLPARNQLGRQRLLERAELAAFEHPLIAIDLGDQAALRRYRVDVRRLDRERVGDVVDLAEDLALDLAFGAQSIPKRVDLVEHREAAAILPSGRDDEVAPHREIALGHAGIDREDEEHRMRVRQEVEREFGLGADRVEAGRIEDDQALLEQRMREIHHRMPPAGDLDGAVGPDRAVRLILVGEERVVLRVIDRDELGLANPLERGRERLRVTDFERDDVPFLGKALVLGGRGVLCPGFDRQEHQLWWIGAVPHQFGRAHRGAARRGGQQPPAVLGEEDRVDELGLAARELGDERDRELVFGEPSERFGEAQFDIAVGELVFFEPAPVRVDPVGDEISPGAVVVQLADQTRAHPTGTLKNPRKFNLPQGVTVEF